MWSSRNKMLLDAEGDGEDDVAFLSGMNLISNPVGHHIK